MRDVTPQTLKFLAKNRGVELILLIGVQWVDGGEEILYSDQKIDGADYPYPRVLEISNFDTLQTVSNITDSQSISVTVNDSDGKIKEIIDSNNICKQPASVYFLFKGLTLAHKVPFFTGLISGPIVWDEGSRSLSFNILSELHTIDVGFSMEEGDFPSVPEEALGKAWPLVFGQVCNMPTVVVRSPRRGILLRGEGIHDFTLHPRICQANLITCPAESKGQSTIINKNTVITVDEVNGQNVQQLYNESTELIFGPDLNCVARRFETICNLQTHLENQRTYEHATLNISGGDRFPQGEYITINIGGARFRGTFSGTYFTIQDREHPEYADWDHIACHPVEDRTYGLKIIKGDLSQWEATDSGTAYRYIGPRLTLDECENQTTVAQESLGGPEASWAAYNEMESAGFHWCPAGSEVLLEDEKEVLHIVSLLPGTVDMVAAYYKMPTGRELLMEVPTDYYTVYETDYLGYDVVEIGLEKNLSEFDENWNDQLYVSFTSSVGPNPVDIIEWLLEKYTTYDIDAASFAAVKASLTLYPCNFWLQERKDILTLINDIVYQSRCGMYIRANTVFLKYLSEEPVTVRTLTESDILLNTLKVKLSETEDTKTKQVVSWKKTGAGVQSTDNIDLKFTLKHNIERYGSKEVSYNYYTQNTYSTILKSSTFWLIRESNIWKVVEFDTPLANLDLDIWDCVEIDTDQFEGKCIITTISYDWENNSIHFEGWTPILAGQTVAYAWAWPATQNPLLTFPLPEDESQEAGYDFEITPPLDHLLLGGGIPSTSVITTGDRHPSDLDDILPTVTCEISDIVDLDEVYEEVDFEAQLAEQDAGDKMDESQTAGGGSDKDEKPKAICGHPDETAGCKYEVIVHYITPVLVSKTGECGGPCSQGTSKNVCTGSPSQMCHVFGAMFSAHMFYMQKSLEGCGHCPNVGNFTTGVSRIYGCPSKVRGVCPDGETAEESPGDPTAPNQGEMYEPGDA
jgi:hypothetical protein